jgi:MraZ protein
MRFTGNIDAKVDEKGRVFVPSSFRKILLREESQGLILRRDVFQRCLVLFPQEVWDEQVNAITARTNMFDRQGRDALRRFVAGAESITLDSGGRMLIPRRYLEESGIQNEVRFIGVDNTIEIWNRQAADALLNEPDTLADTLEGMMSEDSEKFKV